MSKAQFEILSHYSLWHMMQMKLIEINACISIEEFLTLSLMVLRRNQKVLFKITQAEGVSIGSFGFRLYSSQM